MNKLRSFYNLAQRILAAILALTVVLGVTKVAPMILSSDLQDKFVGVISSFGVISFIFLIGEWLIRKHIWKPIYEELNFRGEWHGETFYTALEQPTNKITLKDFKIFSSNHDVFIEQDCFDLSIQPSKGSSYSRWGSIAVRLEDDSTIDFLYWVKYTDKGKFPTDVTGQETLSATKFVKKEREGLPILLTGGFYHCAGREKPIYSGDTLFIRKGYEHLITKDDLPGFAKNGKLAGKIDKGTLK